MLLGASLVFAGIAHLTFSRRGFRAQVPVSLPLDEDLVVVGSGAAEIGLGSALIAAGRRRVPVGWLAAAFFVAVFPGNISQLIHRRDAFGLDTDAKRWARLPFQPVLVAAALWSTGAWRDRSSLARQVRR
ncbi:DoxX family protein [Schumannella luteola]